MHHFESTPTKAKSGLLAQALALGKSIDNDLYTMTRRLLHS